jgi:hypothetical protein
MKTTDAIRYGKRVLSGLKNPYEKQAQAQLVRMAERALMLEEVSEELRRQAQDERKETGI